MTSITNSFIPKQIDPSQSIKTHLITYYNSLKDQIKGKDQSSQSTSSSPSSSCQSQDELPHLSSLDILNYIIESVNILINIKSNSHSNSFHLPIEYESLIQRLENTIRHHCKVQLEQRLKIKALEEYLLDYTESRQDNQRELNLQAENSNLKATIEKYEIIIQHADVKEKEMTEEFELEKRKLMTEIRRLESVLEMGSCKEIKAKGNANMCINDISSDSNYVTMKGNNGSNGMSCISGVEDNDSKGKYTHRVMNSSNMHRQVLLSTSHLNLNNNPNKAKKADLMINSKTANQINKFKGRIIKGKAKALLISKENSLYNDTVQSDDNTIGTPVIKEEKIKAKKMLSKLHESLSIKDYYIATYKKNMNSSNISPLHNNKPFSSNNSSSRLAKQASLNTKPTIVTSPIRTNCITTTTAIATAYPSKNINSYRHKHKKSQCNSPQFKKFIQHMQLNINKQPQRNNDYPQQKYTAVTNMSTNTNQSLNYLTTTPCVSVRPYGKDKEKDKEKKNSSRQNSIRKLSGQ